MSRKGRRILWIVLAAVLFAAVGSQCAFLLRHPYFRKYAAMNGISLREARDVWGKPDRDAEQILGMIVEADAENWEKVSLPARISGQKSALTTTTCPTRCREGFPTG